MERGPRPPSPDRLGALRTLRSDDTADQAAVKDRFSDGSVARWMDANARLDATSRSPGKTEADRASPVLLPPEG
jgi:hypothetical protein